MDIEQGQTKMPPEAKARQLIDQKLERAGWTIQSMSQINLAVGLGGVW